MTDRNVHPAIQAILARRSVRDGYRPDPASIADLEQIVAAGLAAPSSKNARPWRLHVVYNPVTRRRIAMAMRSHADASFYTPHDPITGRPWPAWQSTVAESADILMAGSVGIFVENRGAFSRGRDVLASADPVIRTRCIAGYTYEILGLGAAIQNMWIAATALGLSAVFMGDVAVAEDFVRRTLHFDGDVIGVLVIGYADTTREPPPQRFPSSDSAEVLWHDR